MPTLKPATRTVMRTIGGAIVTPLSYSGEYVLVKPRAQTYPVAAWWAHMSWLYVDVVERPLRKAARAKRATVKRAAVCDCCGVPLDKFL